MGEEKNIKERLTEDGWQRKRWTESGLYGSCHRLEMIVGFFILYFFLCMVIVVVECSCLKKKKKMKKKKKKVTVGRSIVFILAKQAVL